MRKMTKRSIRTKKEIEEIKAVIIRTSAMKNKRTLYMLTELTNISMKTNRINTMKTIKDSTTETGSM
jgi:ABC-type metal ion transport system substrate-binding protein